MAENLPALLRVCLAGELRIVDMIRARESQGRWGILTHWDLARFIT